MLYTYFSARGIDIAAYTSAPSVAHRIAYDAPSFNYRIDAERWIAEIGNPRIAAALEKENA